MADSAAVAAARSPRSTACSYWVINSRIGPLASPAASPRIRDRSCWAATIRPALSLSALVTASKLAATSHRGRDSVGELVDDQPRPHVVESVLHQAHGQLTVDDAAEHVVGRELGEGLDDALLGATGRTIPSASDCRRHS